MKMIAYEIRWIEKLNFKGDLIKTDIFRVLLDYESEEELYEKQRQDSKIDIL